MRVIVQNGANGVQKISLVEILRMQRICDSAKVTIDILGSGHLVSLRNYHNIGQTWPPPPTAVLSACATLSGEVVSSQPAIFADFFRQIGSFGMIVTL